MGPKAPSLTTPLEVFYPHTKFVNDCYNFAKLSRENDITFLYMKLSNFNQVYSLGGIDGAELVSEQLCFKADGDNYIRCDLSTQKAAALNSRLHPPPGPTILSTCEQTSRVTSDSRDFPKKNLY